jgi:hypothetical protein
VLSVSSIGVRVDIVTDAQLIDIVAKGFDAGIRTRDAQSEAGH